MVGVIISNAKVNYYSPSHRYIELNVSLDRLISYEEIQKRAVPQNQEWVREQQEKAANKEPYDIASWKEPLNGYGVGIIPYWNDKFLMGGKLKSAHEIKLTSIIGNPDNYSELVNPLFGAMREFCEEVSFRDGKELCLPSFSGAKDLALNIDEGGLYFDSLETYVKRFSLYKKWGLVEDVVSEKLSYQLDLESSPVDFDTIIIHDKTNDKTTFSRGFFYWDPNTSRVNILYHLRIESNALPFSSENKFGTEEIDETSCLVEVDKETLFNLHQPIIKSFRAFTSYGWSVSMLKTISGGFNRAMKDYKDLSRK